MCLEPSPAIHTLSLSHTGPAGFVAFTVIRKCRPDLLDLRSDPWEETHPGLRACGKPPTLPTGPLAWCDALGPLVPSAVSAVSAGRSGAVFSSALSCLFTWCCTVLGPNGVNPFDSIALSRKAPPSPTHIHTHTQVAVPVQPAGKHGSRNRRL